MAVCKYCFDGGRVRVEVGTQSMPDYIEVDCPECGWEDDDEYAQLEDTTYDGGF